jgi:hypothetical protein
MTTDWLQGDQICEEITQNLAHPIFLPKLLQNIYREWKYPKSLGYFCNFQTLSKVHTYAIAQ